MSNTGRGIVRRRNIQDNVDTLKKYVPSAFTFFYDINNGMNYKKEQTLLVYLRFQLGLSFDMYQVYIAFFVARHDSDGQDIKRYYKTNCYNWNLTR